MRDREAFDISMIMAVGTVCISFLMFVVIYTPYYASRSIRNVNQQPVVEKTVLETLESRYESCINYYLSSADKCDSLKNQLNEERENTHEQ